MAKLPGGEDIGGMPSGRSGRAIASYDTSAIGRGAAQFGESLQGVGSQLRVAANRNKEEVDQRGAFEAQAKLIGFKAEQEKALQELGQKEQPGAFGFRERYHQQFRKAALDFQSKNVPAPLHEAFDVKLAQLEDGLVGGAGEFERTQRKSYYKTSVADGLTKLENNLYTDPAKLDQTLADGNAFIDALPDEDIGPIEKEGMRRDWAQKGKLAALNGMAPEQRIAALGRPQYQDAPEDGDIGPVDAVVDRIIGVESGGNANAKNPRSSASGLGQFINSTWLTTVRRYRPDLAEGKSAGEILALKNDRALGREMTKAYTQENAEFLTNKGLQITRGNLYLAHFAGPQGASNVLRADPSASVASVLGADTVLANPFLAGKNAGWLVEWAAKKMGGKAVPTQPPDQRFADVDWVTRDKLIAGADAEIAKAEQETEVAAAAAYKSHDDGVGLGIETGKIKTETEILSDPHLDDGDITKHLRALRTKMKEDGDVRDLIANVASGNKEGASVNPFDSEETKTGDKAYDAWMKAAPAEQAPTATQTFVQTTGYIPKPVQATIRQGAMATDATALASAMTIADQMERWAPMAFNRFDGGDDARKRLAMFRSFVNDRGMSGEDAAKAILSLNDPARKVNRETLKPALEKFTKDLTVADVTNSFDTYAPNDEPGAGVIALQSSALMAEYRELAEEAFYSTGGDVGAAKATALAEIKKNWQVSAISGERHLMRMPPEAYYPPIDGAIDYLRNDAMETARAAAKTVNRDVENIAILPNDRTRADIQSKRPPRYRLFYTYQEDGVVKFDEVEGPGWGLDDSAIRKHQKDGADARHADLIERDRLASERDKIRSDAKKRAGDILKDESKQDWIRAREAEVELGIGRLNAAKVGSPQPKPQVRPAPQPQALPGDTPDTPQKARMQTVRDQKWSEDF
jgi:hypothetical protein